MPDKLDCNSGNYQCGGKCQPNTNNCSVEAGEDKSILLDKFEGNIKKVVNGDTNTENLDYDKMDINDISKAVRERIENGQEVDDYEGSNDEINSLVYGEKLNSRVILRFKEFSKELRDINSPYMEELKELDNIIDNETEDMTLLRKTMDRKNEIKAEVNGKAYDLVFKKISDVHGMEPDVARAEAKKIIDRSEFIDDEKIEDKKKTAESHTIKSLELFGKLITTDDKKIIENDSFSYNDSSGGIHIDSVGLAEWNGPDKVIHEFAHSIELENPEILLDIEQVYAYNSKGKPEKVSDHETMQKTNLADTGELVNNYATYNYFDYEYFNMEASELISTLYGAYGPNSRPLFDVFKENGEVKKQILWVLGALLK